MTSMPFKRSLRRRLQALLIYAFLGVLCFFIMIPFFWLLSTSLKPAGEIFLVPMRWLPSALDFSGYAKLFSYYHFDGYLWNTIWLTAVNIVGYVLSCSMVAYAFATQEWKHKNKLFLLVIATMMLPKDVTFYPQFVIFRMIGWYGTMNPLWVPAFFADAYQIFLLRQFFLGISVELKDAAQIDGCSRLRIFWNIYLPLSKPALATSAIYVFMFHWNDFFRPLVYITREENRTATLALLYMRTPQDILTSMPSQVAGAVLLALPCVLIYYFCQRYFIAGMVYKGTK